MNRLILTKCIDKLKELTASKKRDPDLMYILGMLETLNSDAPSTGLLGLSTGVNATVTGEQKKEPFVAPQPPIIPKDAIGLTTLANPNNNQSTWKDSLPSTKQAK